MSHISILRGAQDLLSRMPLSKVSTINPRSAQALLRAHITKVATAVFLISCLIILHFIRQQEEKKDSNDTPDTSAPPEPASSTPTQIAGPVALHGGSFGPYLALTAQAQESEVVRIFRPGDVITIHVPEFLEAIQAGNENRALSVFNEIFGPQGDLRSLTRFLPTTTERRQQQEAFEEALHSTEALLADAMQPNTLPPEPEDPFHGFTPIGASEVPRETDPEVLLAHLQSAPTQASGLFGALLRKLQSAGVSACQAANHVTWGQLYSDEDLITAIRALNLAGSEKAESASESDAEPYLERRELSSQEGSDSEDDFEVDDALFSESSSDRAARMDAEMFQEVQTINKISYLGSGAIKAWSTFLMKRYKHLKIAENSTLNMVPIALPDLEADKELYAIPVVIKGQGTLSADHIVTFMYHAPSHTVIFYDSKKKSIREYHGHVLAKENSTTTLENVYLDIMEKYSKLNDKEEEVPPNFWYNDTRHQYDAFNCGVFVMDWIHRCAYLLMSGDTTFNTVEDILNHQKEVPLSTYDAKFTVRKNILEKILPALKDKTPNIPSESTILGSVAESAAAGASSIAKATGLQSANEGMQQLLALASVDPNATGFYSS
jgi:hypothetical protein